MERRNLKCHKTKKGILNINIALLNIQYLIKKKAIELQCLIKNVDKKITLLFLTEICKRFRRVDFSNDLEIQDKMEDKSDKKKRTHDYQ